MAGQFPPPVYVSARRSLPDGLCQPRFTALESSSFLMIFTLSDPVSVWTYEPIWHLHAVSVWPLASPTVHDLAGPLPSQQAEFARIHAGPLHRSRVMARALADGLVGGKQTVLTEERQKRLEAVSPDWR
jgi:hypothetical protein